MEVVLRSGRWVLFRIIDIRKRLNFSAKKDDAKEYARCAANLNPIGTVR